MEETELRVGGWEKRGRMKWTKRLLTLILVVMLSLIAMGPTLVEYKTANVYDSLSVDSGDWNGPFEENYQKEFNGHLKISKFSYETTDGEAGKLKVLSLSSLINLENQISSLVVNKIKEETKNEGLKLIGNGKIVNEYNEELHSNAQTYTWDAEVESNEGFFGSTEIGERILVKAIFWIAGSGIISTQGGFKTIICIAFGENQDTINQAAEIIENIS